MRASHYSTSNICLSTLWLFIFFVTSSLTIEPYSSNWGVTMINAKVTSYSWIISNYSLNDLKPGESLKSPIFSGDDNNEYQWQLRWFPKGRAFKDHCELFLYLQNKTNVTASYQFHLIDGSGKKTNTKLATQTFSDTEWGFFDFIRQTDLQNKGRNLLPSDTLTIFVEITVREGTTDLSGSCRFSNKVSIGEGMAKFLESNFLSDVQLNVDGQVIKAHRAILAAHSTWFSEQFATNTKMDKINVENASAPVVRQILRLMYTGKIDNVDIMATELLELSNRFGIEQLKLICEESLCKSMKPMNATDLLVLAALHDAKNLEKEASNYIAAHAASVVDSPGFETLEKSHPNPFYLILRTLVNKKQTLNSS